MSIETTRQADGGAGRTAARPTTETGAAPVPVPVPTGTGLADQLAATALATPGIAALEPGITTTLRALDARIRRTTAVARHGLHLDPAAGRLVVEVAVRSLHPVRAVVEELQAALDEALRAGGLQDVEVVVRVQSVA